MIFGPSWTTMAGAVGLSIVLAGGTGFFKGLRYEKDKTAVALAKAVDQARQKEQNLHDDYGVLNDLKDEELRRVAGQRDSALIRLRSHPASVPEAARATAACGTGATVYREDGEFLVREAARADELRAQLGACQAREWASYEALTAK